MGVELLGLAALAFGYAARKSLARADVVRVALH